MRLLSTILISLLVMLTTPTFAQVESDTTRMILPTSIVRQMFKDVKERDHLRFELSKTDSIIRAYEDKEQLYEKEILSLKLSGDDFKKVIENLEGVVATREAQLKDKKQELKSAKRRGAIIAIVEAVVIILLLI